MKEKETWNKRVTKGRLSACGLRQWRRGRSPRREAQVSRASAAEGPLPAAAENRCHFLPGQRNWRSGPRPSPAFPHDASPLRVTAVSDRPGVSEAHRAAPRPAPAPRWPLALHLCPTCAQGARVAAPPAAPSTLGPIASLREGNVPRARGVATPSGSSSVTFAIKLFLVRFAPAAFRGGLARALARRASHAFRACEGRRRVRQPCPARRARAWSGPVRSGPRGAPPCRRAQLQRNAGDGSRTAEDVAMRSET